MSNSIFNGFLAFIFILLCVYGFLDSTSGFDDTDDSFENKKSNMVLYIDHGTGCHYLARPMFMDIPLFTSTGLIPRMDENGGQVCREEDKRRVEK